MIIVSWLSSVNSFVTWPTFVLGEYSICFRNYLYVIPSYGIKMWAYTLYYKVQGLRWKYLGNVYWNFYSLAYWYKFLDVTYTDLYNDATTNVSSKNDMCAFQKPFLFVYTEPSKKIYIREHL